MRRENPPWLFGILAVPSGAGFWGVQALLIPFLLRQHGVSVDRIAAAVAIAQLPGVWGFIASPLVDLGPKRRTWILATFTLSAIASGLAILESAHSVDLVTILLFIACALFNVAIAAVGAVMSCVRPEVRGRAGGWTQAANIGAGSLAGGLGIWMAGFCGLPAVAMTMAAILVLPALAALSIAEDARPRLSPRPLFADLGSDLWDLLQSPTTLVAAVFFLSPAGCGAIIGLISGVGPDYHAPPSEVAWVAGAGGGVLLGVGGLAGGFACDRLHRMTAYALFGLLGGAAGCWLCLGPATPFTYGAGFAAYAFVTGLAFAAFTALQLDVLGHGRRAAGTGYALLFSAGNLPLAYMTWLDGIGYKHGGARGMTAADAVANLATGGLLLLIARYWARRTKTAPAQAGIETAL